MTKKFCSNCGNNVRYHHMADGDLCAVCYSALFPINSKLSDTGANAVSSHSAGVPTPRQLAVKSAQSLFLRDFLVVDTETTGLGDDAEIVEISVIDDTGYLVWSSLVKPTKPIPPEVTAIHGITNEMIADAPDFHEIYAELDDVFSEGRPVVFYNSAYDMRLIRQTAALWCLDVPPNIAAADVHCAMNLYSDFVGSTRWIKLVEAVQQCGVSPRSDAHRAYADCLMTLEIMAYMALHSENFGGAK